MLIAHDDQGLPIEAHPDAPRRARCPGCGSMVVLKGRHEASRKIAHYAHARGSPECDSWREPMLPWHRDWQRAFEALGCLRERPITKEGVLHIADILLDPGPDQWVIELQHSPIGPEIMSERENFYGQMIWIFDATEKPRWRHDGQPLYLCHSYVHFGRDRDGAPSWFDVHTDGGPSFVSDHDLSRPKGCRLPFTDAAGIIAHLRELLARQREEQRQQEADGLRREAELAARQEQLRLQQDADRAAMQELQRRNEESSRLKQLRLLQKQVVDAHLAQLAEAADLLPAPAYDLIATLEPGASGSFAWKARLWRDDEQQIRLCSSVTDSLGTTLVIPSTVTLLARCRDSLCTQTYPGQDVWLYSVKGLKYAQRAWERFTENRSRHIKVWGRHPPPSAGNSTAEILVCQLVSALGHSSLLVLRGPETPSVCWQPPPPFYDFIKQDTATKEISVCCYPDTTPDNKLVREWAGRRPAGLLVPEWHLDDQRRPLILKALALSCWGARTGYREWGDMTVYYL